MSEQRQDGGVFLIFATFVVALFFSQIPLSKSLQWFRPDLPLLVLFFWIIWSPARVGIIYAFSIGLLLDLVQGGIFGQNALIITVLAFITFLFQRQLRIFPVVQQSIFIGLLAALNQLFYYGMQSLLGTPGDSLLFLLPALSSALIWPLIFGLLRSFARKMELM